METSRNAPNLYASRCCKTYADIHDNMVLPNYLKNDFGRMNDIEDGSADDCLKQILFAMQLYIKELELKESESRDKVNVLEKLNNKNDEEIRRLLALQESARTNEEEKRHNFSMQAEEKINELENKLKDKDECLSSLQEDHSKVITKLAQLSHTYVNHQNNSHINEKHKTEEIATILKDRDSLRLDICRLRDEASSDRLALIANLQASEKKFNIDRSDKDKVITKITTTLKEAEKQSKNLQENLAIIEKNYLECLNKLSRSESEHFITEKRVDQFKQHVGLTTFKELSDVKEENVIMKNQFLESKAENVVLKQVIKKLNDNMEHLNEAICANQEKQLDLSADLASSIACLQAAEYKVEDTQKLFLNEKELKLDSEVELENLRERINNFKTYTDKLHNCLSDSRKMCGEHEKIINKLKANTNEGIVIAIEKELCEERRKNLEQQKIISSKENNSKEKAALIVTLEHKIDEYVKSELLMKNNKEIITAELDSISKKYEKYKKYKRDYLELQKSLTITEEKLIEKERYLEKSVNQKTEEVNIFRSKIKEFEKLIVKNCKENKKLNAQVIELSKEKLSFEKCSLESVALKSDLKNVKIKAEKDMRELEKNMRNQLQLNRDLMAKYDNLVAENKEQKKSIENDIYKKDNIHKKDKMQLEIESLFKQVEEKELLLSVRNKDFERMKIYSSEIEGQIGSLRDKDLLRIKEYSSLKADNDKLIQEGEMYEKDHIEKSKVELKMELHINKLLNENEEVAIHNTSLTHTNNETKKEVLRLQEREFILIENVKSLESKKLKEERNHMVTQDSKLKVDQSLNALAKKFNETLDGVKDSERKCEKYFKETHHEIHTLKEKLSIKMNLLDKSYEELELVKSNKSKLETTVENFDKRFYQCKHELSEIKVENHALILDITHSKEQYEKIKADRYNDTLSVKREQDRNAEMELEKNKAEIAANTFKQKIAEQQRILDTYECEGSLKLHNNQDKENEIRSLKSQNADLQSQQQLLKEESMRLKISAERFRDEASSKFGEMGILLNENEKLKRENLNLHQPCKSKVIGLESKVEGVREEKFKWKKNYKQLKHEYDSISQLNYDLKCKTKALNEQYTKLKEEYCEKKSTEQQLCKLREGDYSKLSDIKGECMKLMFVLRRIKNDRDNLRVFLKIIDHEKIELKLENEQLKMEMRNLKTDTEETMKQKIKVIADNKQLNLKLNFLKYMDVKRTSEYRDLMEKLSDSETQLESLMSDLSKEKEDFDTKFRMDNSMRSHLLQQLVELKRTPVMRDEKNTLFLTELAEISKWLKYRDENKADRMNGSCFPEFTEISELLKTHDGNFVDEKIKRVTGESLNINHQCRSRKTKKYPKSFTKQLKFNSIGKTFERSKCLQTSLIKDILKLL